MRWCRSGATLCGLKSITRTLLQNDTDNFSCHCGRSCRAVTTDDWRAAVTPLCGTLRGLTEVLSRVGSADSEVGSHFRNISAYHQRTAASLSDTRYCCKIGRHGDDIILHNACRSVACLDVNVGSKHLADPSYVMRSERFANCFSIVSGHFSFAWTLPFLFRSGQLSLTSTATCAFNPIGAVATTPNQQYAHNQPFPASSL